MAKSPDKQAQPRRRSPLTDFMDASEPLHKGGFAEAPQPELSGMPLSGSISDWAGQISRDAEQESRTGTTDGNGTKPARKDPARSASPTRTARGTSMGGAASAKERAAVGLNPVAGLDISLEDAATLPKSAVTATVQALADLIESGNPLHKNGQIWTPHRPARPEKSEGG